ncbi:hypothetical protein [Ancylobacter sp.]|uniref:hypothetical protein n=1 Tax=Ancylobacter sp. TaxID=1872567 RepID=UPI003C7B05B4
MELPTYYYICPNQFDGDDLASEDAAFDESVDALHQSEQVALDAAKRLAADVGHRVNVDIATEFPSGRREFDHYATVFTSGKIRYA